MSPINTSSTQQTQATEQPVQSSSKNVDIALKVAGVALAALAVGAVFLQLPGELLVAGIVLAGFAALTYLCIASIANSPGSSIVYTSSYRPRPWTFFRPDDSVYYRQPIVLPSRTITIPSYRPAPIREPVVIGRHTSIPAPGIDPRPMREPVGIGRQTSIPARSIDPRPMREPVGIRRR
jgi:hypothetical protein